MVVSWLSGATIRAGSETLRFFFYMMRRQTLVFGIQ